MKTNMETKKCRSYETYRLVRELIRDKSKTVKEIAEITGYSKGYISQLKSEIPHVDETKWRNQFYRLSPEIFDSLKSCVEWMENIRISGDAGNWEWDDNSSYVKAIELINILKK